MAADIALKIAINAFYVFAVGCKAFTNRNVLTQFYY